MKLFILLAMFSSFALAQDPMGATVSVDQQALPINDTNANCDWATNLGSPPWLTIMIEDNRASLFFLLSGFDQDLQNGKPITFDLVRDDPKWGSIASMDDKGTHFEYDQDFTETGSNCVVSLRMESSHVLVGEFQCKDLIKRQDFKRVGAGFDAQGRFRCAYSHQ